MYQLLWLTGISLDMSRVSPSQEQFPFPVHCSMSVPLQTIQGKLHFPSSTELIVPMLMAVWLLAATRGPQSPALKHLANGEKPILITATEDGIKPHILLMVGAQGAGKSTFANGLVEKGFLPWVRINQDTIRHGERGTRMECVVLTGQKLSEGYCCVVDRMNFQEGEIDGPSRHVLCNLTVEDLSVGCNVGRVWACQPACAADRGHLVHYL